MRYMNMLTTVTAAVLVSGVHAISAQTPANDPSARLQQVLPADVSARVLAVIAKARSRQLPAQALENRALGLAAKGIRADSIEQSVVDQETRMERAKSVIDGARGHQATGDEVEAGAEAMRKGVDGANLAELAKAAPSGRSLAVPLYVIGALVDRGLPSSDALHRVEDRLNARASDGALEKMPAELPAQSAVGQAHRPAETGRELAETKRSGNAAGGPPAGVPANGGAAARPTTAPGVANKPSTPGKRP